VDIASSSFSDRTAIFGGAAALGTALDNVVRQYRPRMVGVTTSCLSETIGDDVSLILREHAAERSGEDSPGLVHVSTPSYRGTHVDGFHAAVTAVVDAYARGGERGRGVAVFPGMVSPADTRHLKEILDDCGVAHAILPDYSESLDGGAWQSFERIPGGGTSLEDVAGMGRSAASIELGVTQVDARGASALLATRFGVRRIGLGLPIGIRATDAFFEAIRGVSGAGTPRKYQAERARLVDAYVDGHKYVYGRRLAVYGDADMVVALAGFLTEIGAVPAVCATGEACREFADRIREATAGAVEEGSVAVDGVDFEDIAAHAARERVELLVGSSKGYAIARRLSLPLLRVGFPIHDRVGAGRRLHVGYRGTQALFDELVNILIEREQSGSPVGYANV